MVGAMRRNRRTQNCGGSRWRNVKGTSRSCVGNGGQQSATCQPDGNNEFMLRLSAGIVLIVAGTIWVLQGFEVAFAPESFMTGDRWWVMWGLVAMVAGAGLVWVGWRRR